MYPPRQPKLPADEQTRIIAKESLSLEADWEFPQANRFGCSIGVALTRQAPVVAWLSNPANQIFCARPRRSTVPP